MSSWALHYRMKHFLGECVIECTLFSPLSRYNMIKDVIMGLGSFQVMVQLMNGTVPLPHNYSMSPDEVVVVEVSLNTSSEQIKVIINKCWATSTPNPADTYSHTFVENRSASDFSCCYPLTLSIIFIIHLMTTAITILLDLLFLTSFVFCFFLHKMNVELHSCFSK